MILKCSKSIWLKEIEDLLFDWRLFVYDSVICIWGGFQNNTLRDILLLYIFRKWWWFLEDRREHVETQL